MKLTLEGEKCTGTNVTMEMYRTKHEFVVVTRGKKMKKEKYKREKERRKREKGKQEKGREKRQAKKKKKRGQREY